MIWAKLDTNGFPGCWSGGGSSQLDQEASRMGFINSPITNLDVSAVLGVRSKSVFTRTEPRPPPAQADARARPHRRGRGCNRRSPWTQSCHQTHFRWNKEGVPKPGAQRERGVFRPHHVPQAFPVQYAERQKGSNSDPLLRGSREYAQAFSHVCEFYVLTHLKRRV